MAQQSYASFTCKMPINYFYNNNCRWGTWMSTTSTSTHIHSHTHTHTYLRIECANTSNNHNRMIQRIQFIVRLVIRLKYVRMYICRHVHIHIHTYNISKNTVMFDLLVLRYMYVSMCISRCGRLCWECKSRENWEYLKNVIHLDRQGMYICLIPLDHP